MKALPLVLLAGIIAAPAYAEDLAPATDQAGQDHRGHMAHARRASSLRGGEARMRANGGTDLREGWSPVAGFFGGR